MNKFIYSKAMLYILAILLLITFFLPDIIGPYPAIVAGSLVIGFALWVYNKWNRTGSDEDNDRPAP